ncbi:MAG TPA: hypothetical protein VGB91_17665 [Rhizomicrobium sp.]
MAENASMSAQSLSEGAERLERLIRGVKDRQFSDAANAPAPKTLGTAFAVSPEEEWSRKFMTAGIGPMDFKPIQMPVVSISAPVPRAAALSPPAPKTLEPAIESPGAVRPGQIGAAIAKPTRKRSWFGRLVRGT